MALKPAPERLPDRAPAQKSSGRQEQLLPFLLDPNSYPHRPRRVRLVQTHSSLVFITPPYVYKVKRPVNFGFLNFSTLERRCYYCEREVTLNRRLCPDMYLRVVPITKVNGRLTFDGEGEVVEYVVQMRKLSERYFLDKLIHRRAIKPKDLNRVVATLKKFYEAQHPTEEIESWGQIKRLKISTDENFRQTKSLIGQTLSQSAFETIRCYTNEFYRRNARLFNSRIKQRWIRDCHGDLHLEHIHLTPRSLHIYDCIEFNDRLRYVDVANDAAFLAMDLDYKGRPDLAKQFVAKLAAALRDPGMLGLMNFYKCYRAYVRGKVESLSSLAESASEMEHRQSAERARRYFRLALQYAVAGSEPLVLVVMGRIASGKSTLARALADELRWPVFSSDRLRKELAGLPLFRRGSLAARTRLYSQRMTQKVYDRLLEKARTTVDDGRNVILDATFAQRAQRDRLIDSFQDRSRAVRFVEVQAGNVTLRRRLAARDSTLNELSDARLEDFVAFTRRYEPPRELRSTQRVSVSTAQRLPVTLTKTLTALALGRVP